MCKNIIFLVLTFLNLTLLHARITVEFDSVQKTNASLGMELYLDAKADFSNAGMQNVLGQPWRTISGDAAEISGLDAAVWLKIPLDKIRRQGHYPWLMIVNPHINQLRMWIVDNDTICYAGPLTGDNYHFHTRPFPTRNFLFQLDTIPQSGGFLLLAAEKRSSNLDLPLHFHTDTHLVRTHDLDQKYIMFFLGFAAFLFLFNTYLFLTTRDDIFGWYLIYLFLIISYVGMDIGLYFKAIYPNLPQINDIVRPAAFALSIVPMLLFFNRIIEIPEQSPMLNQFNKILAATYMILFVLAVSTSAIFKNSDIHHFWLQANRVTTPLVLGIIFAQAFYFHLRGHYLAIFSLGSLFSLLFFVLLHLAHQLYLVKTTLFTRYALYWALSADALFMGLSLARRFWFLRSRVEQLILEKEERQLQLTLELSAWKEQQLQQISTFLHDRIGALMGILRLSADNMSLSEKGRQGLAREIVDVAEEIRQYSHTNSPVLLHARGLKETIHSQMQKLRSKSNIRFHLEWEGDEHIESDQLRIFLYFCVQEMFQNMLKHAYCSQVIVQVMNLSDKVYLYFEDNGRGAADVEHSLGAGLKSMKRIVDLLGGRFEVQATPDIGFSLSIELLKS
jgi:signal transduction histidine kinase